MDAVFVFIPIMGMVLALLACAYSLSKHNFEAACVWAVNLLLQVYLYFGVKA